MYKNYLHKKITAYNADIQLMREILQLYRNLFFETRLSEPEKSTWHRMSQEERLNIIQAYYNKNAS